MLSRKNVGAILVAITVLLGLVLLIGTAIWWQNKTDMMLGAFVLILYGIGQWMSVVYWQRIQGDWEATGEVLGRLQQAVSNIPAALDANLKAIALKLAEGQQQALSKLQTEVSEGARQTLEKGAGMIGDSIAKNFQAPVASLSSLVNSFGDRAAEQAKVLQAIAETARQDSRQTMEKSAALVTESLEKNLRAPLSALEASLTAWREQAAAEAQASLALGQELRRSQTDWESKAEKLSDEVVTELKSLAERSENAGRASQASWTERAEALQQGWDTRMQAAQSGMVAALTGESEKLGARLDKAAETLLENIEALQTAQSETQSNSVGRALTALEGQSQSLEAATLGFAEGLKELRVASQELVAEVEAKTAAGHAQLIESLSSAQEKALGAAGKNLEAQGQIGLDVAGKVSELAEQMLRGSKDLQELTHVSQINQAEMQAGVSMLNSGLSSILDRLEKQAATGDGYQTLLAELGAALASFQDRAAEVLVENAMKTQEILMEVLNHNEDKASKEAVA